MKNLALGKQMNERKDFFPWLNIFLNKLVHKFPNDLDKETLQFLLQNIEEEINSLSNSENEKTKEVLFDTLCDLFLHFWWRIHWNGKKKWSRCCKTVSSEVSYAYDERTKCCEKLLYYIIFLGITLSNGCPDSEWIGKVLEAIHILPRFDDMVYNSLLRVNNLEKKYHHVYIAILKHILCSEVAENISEPITYVKIIMLFRRLKKFTKDKIALSALKSMATSIKPPSNTIQWLSSLEINISLEKHKSIAKALLSNKFSNEVFHKLQQIINGSVDSEQEAESLTDISEEMNKQKDISNINRKHLKKHQKRNRKSHTSHSMETLNDSIAFHNTDITAAATSIPFYNSKVKIKLNHKMLAGFHTSPKSKELERKKKNHVNNSNIPKKEFNDDLSIKVNDMNEFLNFSFAEISNFSKSVTPLPQKMHCAAKSINVNENNILPEETDSSISLSSTNISSPSNHKRKRAEFCNGSLNDKKIKLDAKKDCNKIQSEQENYLSLYGTSISDDISCFNSPSTLNSNKTFPENDSCSQETTDSVDQCLVPSPSHSPDYFANSDLLNKETATTEGNATKRQQVLLKVPVVSIVDVKNLQTSALLKLVEPLDADLTSSLPSEVSVNTSIENGNEQFDIDWNRLNTIPVTDELCEITQKTDNSKLNNEVKHDTPILNPGKFNIDCNLSNAKMSINKSSDAVQETVNSKLNFEMFPNANVQNNTNSAIATNKFSSLLCSTKNSNESVVRSGARFANFEDPSLRLCNSLSRSASWVENSPSTKGHRWGKSQSMIPTTSKTLELTHTNLTNSQNNSIDNTQHATVNSEIFRESNSINQNTDDRVCVTQIGNTSHCVVDCNIVSDYDPNNSQNNESTSSIKVFINVTCKTPEDSSSHQKHIFGNFDDKRTNEVTPNTSENYFNSLNPFFIESSTSEMPKLTPYYEDPPFLTRSIDAIATPPDSELDVSVPGSFKRDNIGCSKNIINKKLLDKRRCLSTPKKVSSALPKKLLTNDSDFRTPNTSDCETSNEWSLDNTNLTNSLLLINSLQNSPVANVLEQLNSKTPDKNKTLESAATLNKKVTYRSNENVYSDDEFSDASTISRISTTDIELNCALKKHAKHRKYKDNSQQKPNKVFQKKRKNPHPKKWQSEGLQGDSSCIANNRYNLRSREKLLKSSNLKDFLTMHD